MLVENREQMNITVYTTPNCVQCDNTKRLFDRNDIVYSTVDLSTNEEAYNKVTGLGHKMAPVVIVDEDHWSGFRIEKINSIISRHRSEENFNVQTDNQRR